jgi:hypothetical protein
MPSPSTVVPSLSKAQEDLLKRIVSGNLRLHAHVERYGSNLSLRFTMSDGSELNQQVADRLIYLGWLSIESPASFAPAEERVRRWQRMEILTRPH